MLPNRLVPREENRLALAQQSPFPLTLPAEIRSFYEILPCSVEGSYLSTPQGIYNSKVRSPQEAKKTVEKWLQNTGASSTVVVIGLELGYHVLEILTQDSYSIVWVIEFSLDTIAAACQVQDFSSFIKANRLHICQLPSSGDISSVVLSIPGDSFSLFIHRPTYEHNRTLVEHVKQQIESIFQMKSVNTHTVDFFQGLWVSHILRNFGKYLQSPSTDTLLPFFEKSSVIIVAAGPSLENNISLLKNLFDKKSCVIIAVNTVVPRLYHENIFPDIVVAADPQNILYHNLVPLFRSGKETMPILVLHPSVSPVIVHHYSGPIVFWESPLFSHLVPKHLPQKHPLDMGGSVTTAAYSLAIQLRPKNITFLGLDLSYGKCSHIRGNNQDLITLFSSSRLQSWEKQLFQKSQPPLASLRHAGFFGTEVWIDYKFQTYIEWLENRLTYYGETFLARNCTEGGVAFRSILNIPLSDIVTTLSRTANTAKKISKQSVSIDLSSVRQELRHLLQFFENALQTIFAMQNRSLASSSFTPSSEEQKIVEQLLQDEWITLKIKKPFADLEKEQQLSLRQEKDLHNSRQWASSLYDVLLTALGDNIALLTRLLPLFSKR